MAEPQAGMMVTPNVRLVRLLGEGGMGSVWVADHLALHTHVVVKFIAEDLAKNAEALARFSREAAAASQVKSPHVVQTLDHGVTPDGRPYIVMELLEGRDLASYLAAYTRMTPTEVVNVVLQLSRALDRAHARGIVHRDIKPNNIFLCDAGDHEIFVKLLDFGIAKGVDVPSLEGGTKTGSMIGTPYYMSPEQLVGSKDIDSRTDLWSVGVVAFEALTGAKPFDADTVGGLALKIHTEPLPKPTEKNPDLPATIDAWFARACARKPADRFGSAKEMGDALAVAITGQAPASSPVGGSVPPRSFEPAALARTAKSDSFQSPAATDAGVERARSGAASGRTKLVAIGGVVIAVGIAAFAAPGLLRKNDAISATTNDVTITTARAPTGGSAAPTTTTPASAIPSAQPDPSASSAKVATPPTPGGRHPPHPTAQPSAIAAPAPSVKSTTSPVQPPPALSNDVF